MALIRVQRRPTYQGLRQRMLGVLTSDAARKIDFHLDQIHVVGSEVRRVLAHLLLNPRGPSPLTIGTGNVTAGAGADYDQNENRFGFPSENYGETADDRASIFHECVHAWRDASTPAAQTRAGVARRLLWRATKVTDEAAAYVAESLFYYYDTNSGERVPGEDGIHREADRIAERIMNRPGILVPAASVAALKRAIMAQPLYSDIAAFPMVPYSYDGI